MIEVIKPNLENQENLFWMSWDDFSKHFAAINVLRTNDNELTNVKSEFIQEGN
jgi:hypothetical protein